VYSIEVSMMITEVILVIAAVSDIRRREVSDRYWWAIVIFALPFVAVTCSFSQSLQVISAALLFAALLLGGGIIAIVCTIAVIPIWILGSVMGGFVLSGYSVSVILVLLYFLLYRIGMIAGGADAKCLMSITVAFPVYNVDNNDVLAQLFAPSFAILFLSALLTVIFGGIWLLWKNKLTGLKDMPCYRTSLAEAEGAFVWPKEDFRAGRVVGINTPDYDDIPGIYSRLRDNGVDNVLVSPMFPFIVPLAVSFVIVAVFGCPFAII